MITHTRLLDSWRCLRWCQRLCFRLHLCVTCLFDELFKYQKKKKKQVDLNTRTERTSQKWSIATVNFESKHFQMSSGARISTCLTIHPFATFECLSKIGNYRGANQCLSRNTYPHKQSVLNWSQRSVEDAKDGQGSGVSVPGCLTNYMVAPPTVSYTLDTPVGGSTSTGAELPGWGYPSRRHDGATHSWWTTVSRCRLRTLPRVRHFGAEGGLGSVIRYNQRRCKYEKEKCVWMFVWIASRN